MLGDEDRILRDIDKLKDEHKKLDDSLEKQRTQMNQLQVQRIKRRKLWLKDEIARLSAMLCPDIIA